MRRLFLIAALFLWTPAGAQNDDATPRKIEKETFVYAVRDADTLRLLHRVETLDIKLLIRGADRDTRKTELRALVLKAQATAQALDAGDADPLQSIGGAA
jgi:hypothetical protein